MDGQDNDAVPGVSNYDFLLRRLPSINLTPAADSQVFSFLWLKFESCFARRKVSSA